MTHVIQFDSKGSLGTVNGAPYLVT